MTAITLEKFQQLAMASYLKMVIIPFLEEIVTQPDELLRRCGTSLAERQKQLDDFRQQLKELEE
jgi:hypothetical protein